MFLSKRSNGTIRGFTGVSFTSADTGTVVGYAGTILRTADGGEN